MDLHIYFEPVSGIAYHPADENQPKRIGDIIKTYSDTDKFPALDGVNIALIGVPEERNAVNNEGCSESSNAVRQEFYDLYSGSYNLKIADLGNIKAGHQVQDTYFAVSDVVAELIRNQIIPIIIGGSQDLTYANYLAYKQLGQIINIAQVDSHFDLGNIEDSITSQTYLSKIITHRPNFLFNYANIGYQTYFVDQKAIDLMRNLYFDAYRLGLVRSNMEEVEPIVRNADMLSFDISSIKQADAPGNGNASPNGFYGEEACQITRYAGLSDKLTSIGFYEINTTFDNRMQTVKLVAQMIWYFVDGYYNRKNDLPYKEKEQYTKYVVPIKSHQNDIIFYKSKKSDRWWMEVPCPVNLRMKFERHYLVPCSYNDYQTACQDEMPDRWWQVYQKIM